jgi:sugar lactone lactonase YvrE
MTILIASLLAPSAAAARSHKWVVVANHVFSPRGLTIGADGKLYIAQSGDATHSGSILQVRNPSSHHPRVRTIARGFVTIGNEGEFESIDGISIRGRGEDAKIYAQMGLAPQITGNPASGALLKVRLNGRRSTVANVGEFMYQWTNDHKALWQEFPDSNPYGVLAIPGHVYVTDAGANTLDEVMPNGTIKVLAYFPNTAIRDAIPTCVARGPDGALYVGTLAFVEGLFQGIPAAKVYRVDPRHVNLADPTATPMTEWASGLWPINGCTFGKDGTFYASQMVTRATPTFTDPHGDVVKIPWRHPDRHIFLTGGALSFTAGVAVGRDGSVYVSDGTAFVPEGRVLRLTGDDDDD